MRPAGLDLPSFLIDERQTAKEADMAMGKRAYASPQPTMRGKRHYWGRSWSWWSWPQLQYVSPKIAWGAAWMGGRASCGGLKEQGCPGGPGPWYVGGWGRRRRGGGSLIGILGLSVLSFITCSRRSMESGVGGQFVRLRQSQNSRGRAGIMWWTAEGT